eukprot:gnl/TRDRNA2_/TRDRNA2_183389_c0_seq1.p1 gnl/TRDRNA2_/TRDRNA2_183389_c0~~gnl/TRDRNA2_/TRDRNA2_183389_c0_seq1.p1  ORF type:complete len:380 (+),score=60.59 gnl/TRDRNA2_/TRDRNA2_183389_c0_seq1:49-1188(+)
MVALWFRLIRLSPFVARVFTRSGAMPEHYRHDGVRITHDPYAPGMAEKYGLPGKTDNEGFDPYADSVGAGIYGGRVKRDALGMVVIGKQYQNHNPRPGPVYNGGGYTPMSEALKDLSALSNLLDKYPDLVNDVSTGGALPLHMCGMGGANQMATEILVQRGGDIEALDTYGFTPLHRMASNNLAHGARVLLEAGADPMTKGACGQTPMAIAQSSAAKGVIKVLQEFSQQKQVPTFKVSVMGAGIEAVNGEYEVRDAAKIPEKFALVCQQNGWNTQDMWQKLADPQNPRTVWFEAPNKSYIYFNAADGHWWLDGPDGLGVYKARASRFAVPAFPRGSGGAFGWFPLDETSNPVPSFLIHRNVKAKVEVSQQGGQQRVITS